MEDLFAPSRNCWQVETAGRAAFIVDGEAYFRAVYEAVSQAQQTVFIVGWDLHSDVRLLRSDKTSDYPVRLGKLLDRLARERSALQIYLLSWDFAMIYALEREFFPRYKLKWRTHERIHFYLDGEHPIGASQHQKLVVVDDRVAFCGGFDLSKWRWDSRKHRIDDERRRDPDGKQYPPFHDVQMAVDGEAAAALGQLARHRWQRACGEDVPLAEDQVENDPWPDSVEPVLRDISVAISRTMPRYENNKEIREVEHLYLDSIEAARSVIYIENQYLSSYKIGEALKQRLREEHGPEIVVVMPCRTGGWLEQHTMDVLRSRIVRNLRDADDYDRFRIYYPRLSDSPPTELMVHAKVMIIDDCFVRVGSSNLSNRSLGLDSECDLAFVAAPDSSESQTIVQFRNALIAEHLETSAEKVTDAIAEHGSLGQAIEALRGGERTLLPLQAEVENSVEQLVPDAKLLDPEQPVEPDDLVEYIFQPEQKKSINSSIYKVLALVAIPLLCTALWRWTSLGDWLSVDKVIGAVQWLKSKPLTPLFVPLIYVVGSVVAFPVTLLIIATMVIFGPWLGAGYALVGSQLGALLGFTIGRLLGRKTVSRLAGSLINRVNRSLSESGFFAVVAFRVIPVAPFSVINLVAGVSSLRWLDFILGTLVGMLPAIVAFAVVGDRLVASLKHPDWLSGGAVLAVAGIAIVFLAVLKRGVKRWFENKDDHPE